MSDFITEPKPTEAPTEAPAAAKAPDAPTKTDDAAPKITLQSIRERYSGYQDMSDDQLAHAMHQKFYPDMPLDDFFGKIGYVRGMADSRGFVANAKQTVTGQDPEADYDTGLPFMDRAFLARMDNDAERRAYLESRYGKDGVSMDQGGRFLVTRPGQRKRVSASGGGTMSGISADMTGNVYPLAGATAGGIIGAGFGGFGAPFGAAAGGMLGKGLDELLKDWQGYRRKTPEEEQKELANTGNAMAAGEGFGQVVTRGIGRALRGQLPTWLTGVDPETAQMTATTLRGGGVPPISSAMPHSKRLQWWQALSEKVVGPFSDQQRRNAALIEGELKNILRESGVPESAIDTAYREIANPTAAVSTRELGEDIQRAVKAHVDTQSTLSRQDMDQATALLDQRLQHLTVLTRRFQTGDLGVDVGAGIETARKDFGTAASKLYGRVDRLVGNEEIVPTASIKREAQRVWESLPKTAATPGTPPGTQRVQQQTPRGQIWHTEATPGTSGSPGSPVLGDPRVLKVLGDLQKLPDNISFRDAQSIRTTLAELGEMRDLTPGVTQRHLDDLRQSVNTAFGVAEQDPRAAAALALKRQADAWYAKNIEKFKDATVNKLVRDTQAGMPPDPEVVARTVLRPGQTARARELKGMLPEATWRKVVGADFDNMITTATRQVDGVDVVRGVTLLKEIEKRGDIFDVTYSPRLAAQIRDYAKRLAARDGAVPVADLTPDNFSLALARANQRIEGREAFLNEHFLGSLADPKKLPDDALRWIVQPKQETRLIEAIKFFGEQSPQVEAIRQAALRDLLNKTVGTTESGVGQSVAGGGMERALQGFTQKQQDLLFPNGLADDIRLVAKEAKFLFPPSKEGDMSAGLAAGAIKALPIGLYAVAAIPPALAGWLLSRPGVVRYLALGLRGGGATRESTMDTMRFMARQAALGLVPDVGGSEQQGQQNQGGNQPP